MMMPLLFLCELTLVISLTKMTKLLCQLLMRGPEEVVEEVKQQPEP